jgi:hypothetical protein
MDIARTFPLVRPVFGSKRKSALEAQTVQHKISTAMMATAKSMSQNEYRPHLAACTNGRTEREGFSERSPVGWSRLLISTEILGVFQQGSSHSGFWRDGRRRRSPPQKCHKIVVGIATEKLVRRRYDLHEQNGHATTNRLRLDRASILSAELLASPSNDEPVFTPLPAHSTYQRGQLFRC